MKDFISGKRAGFYNIIYLLLIVIALILYVQSIISVYNSQAVSVKATHLTDLPLYAVAALFLFSRIKYNFFKHIMIAAMIKLCEMLLLLVRTFLELLSFKYFDFVQSGLICATFLIAPVVYYQVTKGKYKFYNFIWRAILIQVFVILAHEVVIHSLRYIYFNISGGAH